MQNKLYFAYGSNMNTAQMAKRCPGSKRLGAALLPGYRWIIASDGYANAIASSTDAVEGVLFEITENDEAQLDIYEEVSAGCYAKHELPVQHGGTTVQALVYLNPLTTTGVAAPNYLDPLRTAVFVDGALSEVYLQRYILPFIQP